MKEVISQIKKSTVPSKAIKESKNKIAHLALELIRQETKKHPQILGVEFGGSFAKNTWSAKDTDVDIFVRFKESTSEKKLEEISREVGFESLKKYTPYVRYSEHPYVEAKIRGTRINLVPFYNVKKGNWKSSADRSPFHTVFMKKSLTPKMQGEVMILKQFLKANKIYGAEIARQGFSGYVSEVLILNYGTFEDTIKGISEVVENSMIGKTPRKFDTSISIIDPVDKDRNLAAAISDENIGRFILAARAFREKPSKGFFRVRKTPMTKKHWDNVVVVKFRYKARSPDIIWGQVKRASISLSRQLGAAGFDVIRNCAFADTDFACLFFLLREPNISELYQKNGPDFFRHVNSRVFISKNLPTAQLMWVGADKRLVSLERRRFTDAQKFLTDLLRNNLRRGVPKGLHADFERGFKVSRGRQDLDKSIKGAINEMISTDGAVLYFN